MKTALQESDREFNVVMFNVEEEDENGDSSEDFNNEIALDVMKCADLESFTGDFSTERIGVTDTERSRPLKVQFNPRLQLLTCCLVRST